VRRSQPDDVAAAHAILAAWERDTLGEAQVSVDMFASGEAIADASYVAETAAGVAGHASVRGETVNVIVARRERRRGIGTALLQAAEGAATGTALRLTGVSLETAAAPFARANGYRLASEVWLMGVEVDAAARAPAWPDGVSVRTYADADAAELKRLLDVCYAEEGTPPLSFEEWRTVMLADPSFDAGVWFLASAEERLVGAALCWTEGFVKDLVVHPDWRRRGLGSALMREALCAFARRGVRRVALKTDSNNPTQAWRLYARLGMHTDRTYQVFEKPRAGGGS
jgi:mycothiol synthase